MTPEQDKTERLGVLRALFTARELLPSVKGETPSVLGVTFDPKSDWSEEPDPCEHHHEFSPEQRFMVFVNDLVGEVFERAKTEKQRNVRVVVKAMIQEIEAS